MINFQNINDNECFKWSIVRNSGDRNPAKNAKAGKEFAKFNFKDIKFSAKIRDILKIEKKKILSALVFLVMKIKKNLQSMYQKTIL